MAGGFGIDVSKADKVYPGHLTPYVMVTCLAAAFGGLIFGYDIGISGKASTIIKIMNLFFF